MPGIVVVGMQFGDESKGAVVDYLARDADLVVRYNGGANAGHTVATGDLELKFRLMPSGALWGKRLVIGNGVVVDPKVLLDEIKALREVGVEPNLLVSRKAHVVMPYHKVIDAGKMAGSLGTTRRGIGPTYADKARRTDAIRVDDLVGPRFRERLESVLRSKLDELVAYGIVRREEDLPKYREEVYGEYSEYGRELRPYAGEAYLEVNRALDEGKVVLFEGAQGTLLDLDHGTYPYVTSSNPVAGGACVGAGVGPTRIDRVIGVAKAYTTRVGAGPFPTEIYDELGDRIREKGGEYGTVTGRPRRCGWLDLPMLRYSIMINGITEIALRKLDVLGGIRPLKVAVAYEVDGEEREVMTPFVSDLERVRPVYEELDGWEELSPGEWGRVARRGYGALPRGARDYVEFIEERLGVPVTMVGVGPRREDTIERV
ncbi:MAG: adenylosuccinate synthase [Candidatus Korarchaeota archaeon]|nr:adenylosuccinate synthase [Candidatus Korarchaeota archaeon]